MTTTQAIDVSLEAKMLFTRMTEEQARALRIRLEKIECDPEAAKGVLRRIATQPEYSDASLAAIVAAIEGALCNGSPTPDQNRVARERAEQDRIRERDKQAKALIDGMTDQQLADLVSRFMASMRPGAEAVYQRRPLNPRSSTLFARWFMEQLDSEGVAA